ncbi:MAG: lipoyl(octanoyl) transferase LipB [Bacteroidia bacterium]|nr:lipoyl(octanoyl) transferase LipB [Bacteroidia bacterium]
MPKVTFSDWGLIDYKLAWDQQEKLFKNLVDHKFLQRDLALVNQVNKLNQLIFCEHPHVYTLGKSGSVKNLLIDVHELQKASASFYPINRGGDITYHGPGQLVGYPIFDLEQFFTDIHKYLRFLEEAIIITLAAYGITGQRYEGFTGVWIDAGKSEARKICALGVRCSRWITMHGFALNVNTDLLYFKNIIPCGIDDKEVTSMKRELGYAVNMQEVKDLLRKNIALQFKYDEVN